MSATVSFASKASTPATPRRGRRRGRGCWSQTPSPAGRERSESGDEGLGEGSGGAQGGMITQNRFAFLSSTEPAPGAQAECKVPRPPQSAFRYRQKKPKSTPSFVEASACSREQSYLEQGIPLLKAGPSTPQPTFVLSPECLRSASPKIRAWDENRTTSAIGLRRHVKEHTNSETQAFPGIDLESVNPDLLPQLFPSTASLTEVQPSQTIPAPPSRPPDGPISPPPFPYPPPHVLLTPPPSPPPSKLETKLCDEPQVQAKTWPYQYRVDLDKGWPALTNEPMAPATKDRKSRFLPYLNAIAAPVNTSQYDTVTRKKSKHSPPHLEFMSISLASPISDESPVLVQPINSEHDRKGRNKRSQWRLWGNDMSHLRLKTGGFIDRDCWAMKNEGVDVEAVFGKELGKGEVEVFEMEEDARRKGSLGEEWEIVEVE